MTLLRTLATLALIATPAAAQAAEPDGEIWTSSWATGAVSGKVLVSLDGSLRASDKGTRAPTILIRPLIGVAVTKRLSLWGGYTYTATRPDAGGVTSEHRAVQQILWSPKIPGGGALVSRTRMEERWVEGRAGTGYRLREMLRYTHPITRGKTALVLQSEPFFALNDTPFGQASGMDQIRTFIGVNVPIPAAKGLTADIGYMNRYVWRRNAPDKIDHIAATMLIYRF